MAFKIQILLGIKTPNWVDCHRLDKFVEGNWVTPIYATRDGGWQVILESNDPFLADCVKQDLLQVVEV